MLVLELEQLAEGKRSVIVITMMLLPGDGMGCRGSGANNAGASHLNGVSNVVQHRACHP